MPDWEIIACVNGRDALMGKAAVSELLGAGHGPFEEGRMIAATICPWRILAARRSDEEALAVNGSFARMREVRNERSA